MLKSARMALASLSILSSSANAAGPSWLDGTWTGTGYEPAFDNVYSIQLTADSAAGTSLFEAPSLGCRGTWILLSFSASKAIFNQNVDTGPCKNARVVMTQVAAIYASYSAFLPETRPAAFSTLTRVAR